MTGLTKSSLYRLIAKGDFPKPIQIGAASRWSEIEVQAWIETKRKAPREMSVRLKATNTAA